MAKIAYSKFGCKTCEEIKTIEFNGQMIEVKQYLPIQDKLALIGKVVELSHEQDYNYSNPVKSNVFTQLEMVFSYTNISFTDKQKEDIPKLYDQLKNSGLLDQILITIPNSERQMLEQGVQDSIEAIYKYQNSVLGILDTMSSDYDNLGTGFEKIYEKIRDPESFGLLKDVLNKLG